MSDSKPSKWRRGKVIQMIAFFLTIAMLRMTSVSLGVQLRELSAYGKSQQQQLSSTENFPKNAIVTLLGNDSKDVEDMCRAVKSLSNLPDEGKSHVLVFYEQSESLLSRQKYIQECAGSRKVVYAPVDFEIFPVGFDPEKEPSVWDKRSKFGYMQMIRFFISGLWQRPEIEPYETIMRLDSDACWVPETDEFSTFLPGMTEDKVYHANLEKSDSSGFCKGIFEVAEEFVHKNNITVASPKMWENFRHDYYNSTQCRKHPRTGETICKPTTKCRTFYNNFEVVRTDFFRQPMVKKWHEHLADEEPFGVLRHRWGDAIERYLTMAMFAKESSLQLTGRPTGYHHPCCPKGRKAVKTGHMCPDIIPANTTSKIG